MYVPGDNRRVSTSFVLLPPCRATRRGGPFSTSGFADREISRQDSDIERDAQVGLLSIDAVYEPFYAHLRYYYSRVVYVPPSCSHVSVKRYIIKLNCVTVYFNITSGTVSMNCKCVAEKLIPISLLFVIVSFDSVFIT